MNQKFLLGVVVALFLPAVAIAQSGLLNFIDQIIVIVNFFVPFFVSLAIVVFFWGIIKFIAHAGDEKAREEGRRVMIWGMIALFVMVALWAIVGYVQSLLDLSYGGPGTLVMPPNKIP